MKTTATITLLAALTLGLSACNETTSQDARDVRASQGAVAKDQAVINKYQTELERDRAEKAAAKARGDTATQAGKSLEIGANKAIIGGKKIEKDIDATILEEDKKDLRN